MTPELLSRVHARCEECGDCLRWKGATNGKGHPKVAWTDDRGRTHISARRVVWSAVNGPIPKGKLVTVSCQTPDCLNPEHLVLTTKKAAATQGNANSVVRLKRQASSAATNRAKLGKITIEIAREIRSSERSGVDWARELNCSPSLVSHVRRNLSWVEHASPFNGLGAR